MDESRAGSRIARRTPGCLKLAVVIPVRPLRLPSASRWRATAAADRIRPSQRRFVEAALRFQHFDQFTIIEIP
jgi:hypothetical protein